MTTSTCSGKLLAVDPSLSLSGWALFQINGRCPVESKSSGVVMPLAVGVLKPPGTRMEISQRLTVLQTKIEDLLAALQMRAGDILICEGPAPIVLNPDSAIKVERVRGIFETVARSRGLIVPGRINPRTVQAELLGMRGPQIARKEVKKWARETVKHLFGPEVFQLKLFQGVGQRKSAMPQDIVDAMLIGTLALSRIRICSQTGLSLQALFEGSGKKGAYSRTSRRALSWTETEARKFFNLR